MMLTVIQELKLNLFADIVLAVGFFIFSIFCVSIYRALRDWQLEGFIKRLLSLLSDLNYRIQPPTEEDITCEALQRPFNYYLLLVRFSLIITIFSICGSIYYLLRIIGLLTLYPDIDAYLKWSTYLKYSYGFGTFFLTTLLTCRWVFFPQRISIMNGLKSLWKRKVTALRHKRVV